MARVFPNGLLSGRIGENIYRIRNGKNYVAKAPVKGRTATPLQQFQQVKFAAVMAFAKRYKEQVKLGYAGYRYGSFSGFSKHLHQLGYFENDAWQFDLHHLQLSNGSLQWPDIETRFSKGKLKLEWRAQEEDWDASLAVVIDNGCMVSHVILDGRSVTAEIPFDGGKVFAFLVKGKQSSPTTYLGEFLE